MTRGELRASVIGFLLACSLSVGLLWINDAHVTVAIKAQDAHSDSLTKALIVSERERRAAKAEQEKANARADLASAKAEAVANRLGRIIHRVPVPSITPDGTTVITTVRMVPLSDFLTVKYAWEAEKAARLQADSVTIPALEDRIAKGDSLVMSLRESIRLRDERKSPRCGVKCGALLGVLGTLGAAWVVGNIAPP